MLNDPILLRGIERIIIVIGGIVMLYLGYKLFTKEIKEQEGNLDIQTNFFKLVFTGKGPGIFFMILGAVVLVMALFTGGSEKRINSMHEEIHEVIQNDSTNKNTLDIKEKISE